MRISYLCTCFIAILSLASCQSNYFIDPIVTPAFTKPWQASAQANLTINNKFCFEGAAALPSDFAVTLSREFWAHGLDNDQEMTSVSAGKFWAMHDVTWLAMGGFGFGSQRTGPEYAFYKFQGIAEAPGIDLPPHASPNVSYLDGHSDFRRYFLDVEYAHSTAELGFGSSYPGEVKGSWGFATRLEYLNRFRFTQSVSEVSDTSGNGLDTTYSMDISPKHDLALDLAAFLTSGIPYVPFAQLSGQLLLRIPLNGDVTYQQLGVASLGIRFTF